MSYRELSLCAVALILGGCTSVPKNISTPVPGPDAREARANPAAHAGSMVRWGGTISDINNLERRTVITVVARPISRRGEPRGDEKAVGRFLAEIDRFLEPAEYGAGRRITVVGRFTGIRSKRIDQYVYDYPVVRVRDLYVWEEYVERRDRYHRYHCPPFWRYPYSWRHRYYGFHHYPWCW